MAKIELHHLGDYEYQICVYSKDSAGFQGVILVTKHAGVALSPIVEIPIPTHFMARRAAYIEAHAVASQLILTGAIANLIPQLVAENSSWPQIAEDFTPLLKH